MDSCTLTATVAMTLSEVHCMIRALVAVWDCAAYILFI